MKRIGKFHKVSRERFLADWQDTFGQDGAAAYEAVRLPLRATRGSAGYDFYTPCPLRLQPGETVKVPTGIRAEMEEGWVLLVFPRSGLGFQYRLQMDNTVGVIDSDYFYSDNEGHIFVKITNDSRSGKVLELPAGAGFAQGIFMEFGITADDEAQGIRNGGLGSTSGSLDSANGGRP